MKPALALTLLLLAGSAFMFGRNLFATIKGKAPASWVTWLWLGLWGMTVLYGLGSAVPRMVASGESSALLAIGVVVVSVFCQTRIWGHMMARANYAPHGQETVIRGTEVVGGAELQARMYGAAHAFQRHHGHGQDASNQPGSKGCPGTQSAGFDR